ncbi:MAG: tetratricopeptide repeat protein [Candidatus Acidiferrales bacterium]
MKLQNKMACTLALGMIFAALAWAQGAARVTGTLWGTDGKPWAAVTITITFSAVQTKSDTVGTAGSQTTKETHGMTTSVTTDKNGRFSAIGLQPGVYDIAIKNEQIAYTEKDRFDVGDNELNINLKVIAAKQGLNTGEAEKKEEEATAKFTTMSEHFKAGLAAMDDAAANKKQIASTPADQRGPLQDKMKADYDTAITEFSAAEQLVNEKETKNHAVVLGNLGAAYESAGRYQDAADAFQKAADMQPRPEYYVALATNLAKAGKIADAGPNCDKAAAADPTTGPATAETCWRNLGIVLSNLGKMKEAVEPLQKATQMNPKDADAWFLLGNALAGSIETKQQGEKLIYIIPPGTDDAYKKYLELAPSGPHVGEANAMLQALKTYEQPADTTVEKRKKKF